MKTEIGYGEMVFTRKYNVDKGDDMVEKTEVQKRQYKVKRRNGRVQIHRINELQLETLKATPGVICMQEDVIKYFMGYKQQVYAKAMEKAMLRAAANKPAPAMPISWWQKVVSWIKRITGKKA